MLHSPIYLFTCFAFAYFYNQTIYNSFDLSKLLSHLVKSQSYKLKINWRFIINYVRRSLNLG